MEIEKYQPLDVLSTFLYYTHIIGKSGELCKCSCQIQIFLVKSNLSDVGFEPTPTYVDQNTHTWMTRYQVRLHTLSLAP